MDEKTSLDRRAALEDAYEKIDSGEIETEVLDARPSPPVQGSEVVDTQKGTVEEKGEAAPTPSGDKPRDEKGRFAPKAGEEPKAALKPTEPVKAPVAPIPGTTPPAPPIAEPEVKAPPSWRLSEREAWAKIPKEAREPILRREKEISQALNESAEARKNWQRFEEAYRPFEHIMRMNGTQDPVQSAANLMQTAAILQMGTPYQKAGTVAQVIRQFDIDPSMVGAMLEGQMPPQQAQQQFRDPRLDQLLARMEQTKAQREQQEEAKLSQELTKFSESHEYFDQVRDAMADIIDAWSNSGKLDGSNLSQAVQKAYDYAILMDEEVQKVEQQKKAAQNAATTQAVTQRAKVAASSVKSNVATPVKAQPTDRRAVLSERYDELNSR